MRITEVSTPQGLSRNSAMIVVSSNRWVGSSADDALAESFNASLKREILQDRTCWPNTASCRREVSAGWPATTPNDATPDAVIPVRPPTKTTTQPLRCHSGVTINPVSTTWGQGPIRRAPRCVGKRRRLARFGQGEQLVVFNDIAARWGVWEVHLPRGRKVHFTLECNRVPPLYDAHRMGSGIP